MPRPKFNFSTPLYSLIAINPPSLKVNNILTAISPLALNTPLTNGPLRELPWPLWLQPSEDSLKFGCSLQDSASTQSPLPPPCKLPKELTIRLQFPKLHSAKVINILCRERAPNMASPSAREKRSWLHWLTRSHPA